MNNLSKINMRDEALQFVTSKTMWDIFCGKGEMYEMFYRERFEGGVAVDKHPKALKHTRMARSDSWDVVNSDASYFCRTTPNAPEYVDIDSYGTMIPTLDALLSNGGKRHVIAFHDVVARNIGMGQANALIMACNDGAFPYNIKQYVEHGHQKFLIWLCAKHGYRIMTYRSEQAEDVNINGYIVVERIP